jgi:hypothetical protein
MKVETKEKEGWLPAILYLGKLFLRYWGLILGIGAAIVVLGFGYEKFGIIIILIPAFIALFRYHLWIKEQLDLLKNEVEHLRNPGIWPKEERQYFLDRLRETT